MLRFHKKRIYHQVNTKFSTKNSQVYDLKLDFEYTIKVSIAKASTLPGMQKWKHGSFLNNKNPKTLIWFASKIVST